MAKDTNQGEFFRRYSNPGSPTNQNIDLFIALIPDADPRKEVFQSYINQMRLFATEVMQYPQKTTLQSLKNQQDMKDDYSRLFQLIPKYPLLFTNLAKKAYSGSKEFHQAKILKERFTNLVNDTNSVEIIKLNPLKDVYTHRNNMQVPIDKVFKEIKALQHLDEST